jgi:hypothetical protein
LAVTVLLSVTSLKALRVFARKDQAGKPMSGFGDLMSDPDEPSAAAGQRHFLGLSTLEPLRECPVL